jgi:hypothetical protein
MEDREVITYVAVALGLYAAWRLGIDYAYNRGYCAYCRATLGRPGPETLNHWETCSMHPARQQIAALKEQVK